MALELGDPHQSRGQVAHFSHFSIIDGLDGLRLQPLSDDSRQDLEEHDVSLREGLFPRTLGVQFHLQDQLRVFLWCTHQYADLVILKGGYLRVILSVREDTGCIRRRDGVEGHSLGSLPLRADSDDPHALALLLVTEFDWVHELPMLLGHSPLEYDLQLRVDGVQADSVESECLLYLV